jgi:hypothetical protein
MAQDFAGLQLSVVHTVRQALEIVGGQFSEQVDCPQYVGKPHAKKIGCVAGLPPAFDRQYSVERRFTGAER